MARDQNTTRRHDAVKKEFTRLHDVHKLQYRECLRQLAEKFFYSENTIQTIVSGKVRKKRKK